VILYTGSFLKGVGEEKDMQEDEGDVEDHIIATARASIDCIYCFTTSTYSFIVLFF